MFKRLLNALITWEGLVTIPAITFLLVFCAGVIQHLNPSVGVFPELYIQEIVYKISVLIIGSNVVQFGIYINLMLFFKIKVTDIKAWFQQLNGTQKIWLVVCFYALYYIVYAMVRL